MNRRVFICAIAALISMAAPALASEFQIEVKLLTGKTVILSVRESTTVEELKQLITRKEGLPASEQRLLFVGKTLEDGTTLGDYGIRRGSVLHLVRRIG